MTNATASDVRINELLDYVRSGRIMDAMREFYADDVVMEEPAYGRTEGLAANLERERKFVESVSEFKRFEARNVGVGPGVSFYENEMEWVDVKGQTQRVEQLVVAEWRNGRIVRERFYYNMG